MWYVVQTKTGKEEATRRLIEDKLSSDIFEECIVLYCETKRKYLGEWHLEKSPMFPGYLFLVTEDPQTLNMELKKVPELTKILGYEDDFVPIKPEEEAFLKRITGENQVAEMSYGVQEGDRIRVEEGVLKGLESIIRKIDRHKRRAVIEMNLLGEVRQVEIGLEIVRKA